MAYNKAHSQTRVKLQASDATEKFEAANSTARQDSTNPPLENQLEGEDVGIKDIEGYFDNFAAATVNEKSVLQQLVLNNTTLTTSDENLVALVKKINRSHPSPRAQ